jgi:hypothetical protein
MAGLAPAILVFEELSETLSTVGAGRPEAEPGIHKPDVSR